ncbi:MAG: PilZ domain-containing protein [Gallionella sp.]|jgi:hypothetical protein|nr:PilZ domain-containing protein [Gallionella sp.]MCK9354336.1 PilZ domain-containing protein [Gallionella sp.]
MYPEKRKEGRSPSTRQPKGKLQVLAGNYSHPVFEVIDVSTMGIRLRLNSPVNIGENVVIRYQADGIDLKLNGTVIWNAPPANPGGYTIGIKLTSPSILQAFW